MKVVTFFVGLLTIFVGIVSFVFSSLADWGNAETNDQKCYNRNVTILNNTFQLLIAIVTTLITLFEMLQKVHKQSQVKAANSSDLV